MSKSSMRRSAYAIVSILAAGVWGCSGSSFRLPTPPGFVELQDQRPAYDYRATTADGVVIGVREIKNEPKGDAAFWLQAVQNQMRGMSGYALLEAVAVTTRSGLKGTQLRFGHDEKGAPLLYNLTLFVTDKKIYLIEVGGAKDQMTRMATQLAWVLNNFETS